MIRQRVDRHGNIFNLEPASELPGCSLPASEVGVIKEGPVKKWMAAKKEWDTKFSSAKRRVQKQRAKEMAKGYSQFEHGEVPPPSALAGRRKVGEDLKEEKKTKSMGMTLWALWGSKHDEKTMNLEKEADRTPETTTVSAVDGAGARPLDDTKTAQGKNMDKAQKPGYSRSRSRRRTVTDEHQTDNASDVDENTPAFDLLAIRKQQAGAPRDEHLTPAFAAKDPASDENQASSSSTNPAILVKSPVNEEYDLKRPKAQGIAFPFSLKGHKTTASMTTLTSAIGVAPASDVRNSGTFSSGVPQNKADVEATTSTGMSTEEAKAGRELEQHVSSPVNGHKASASIVTLTSTVGVPRANDVRSSEAFKSGVPLNKADVEAMTSMGTSTEGVSKRGNVAVVASGNVGEKVVEDGEIVSAERPPMETFVTASDVLSFSKPAS